MLEMFNAPHNLPAAVFAEMAGKSRRWIGYEVQARRVLALGLGSQGRRVPNWHLASLKHKLVQAVLKHSQGADSWDIYSIRFFSEHSYGFRPGVVGRMPF